MPYRILVEEGVPHSVRRVASEQLDGAARALADPQDPVEAVHRARKHVKKLRALLRLARPGMPKKAVKREMRSLRAVAHALAASRETDAMGEAIEKLEARFVGQLPEATFEALKLVPQTQRGHGREGIPPEAATELTEAQDRLDRWPLDDCGWATTLVAVDETYRRGRTAFAVVRKTPTTENLHEWRKRVKDLWYQQRLLRQAWPTELKAQASASDELAELLGDDHDLAVLAGALSTDHLLAVDLGAVLELVEHRRDELQHDAVELGRRVYAEKPKAFRHRLGVYLDALVDENPLPVLVLERP